MSSNPLSTQMQALIDYANETTGESDTDLSAAVGHLVDGYGSGGGAADFELVETVTLDGTATSFEYNFAKPVREFLLAIDVTFADKYTAMLIINAETGTYFTYNATALSASARYVRKLTTTQDGFVEGSYVLPFTLQDSVSYFRFYDRYNRASAITGTIDIYAIYA